MQDNTGAQRRRGRSHGSTPGDANRRPTVVHRSMQPRGSKLPIGSRVAGFCPCGSLASTRVRPAGRGWRDITDIPVWLSATTLIRPPGGHVKYVSSNV